MTEISDSKMIKDFINELGFNDKNGKFEIFVLELVSQGFKMELINLKMLLMGWLAGSVNTKDEIINEFGQDA